MLEPWICDDRLEEGFGFFHTVLESNKAIRNVLLREEQMSNAINLPHSLIQIEFDRIHLKLLKI